MDRLVRQRQRDARRSGRVVTSISSLPAELLGSIVKYACPYVSRGYGGYEGPYLATFLRVGCTNRGFLEAVQQVEQMRVDVMDQIGSEVYIAARSHGFLDARWDGVFERWCDIASRRFRNVRRFCEGGRGTGFSPTQTKTIVDCAASFPNLEELVLYDCEIVSSCVSIVANVRRGKFRHLRRLELAACSGPMNLNEIMATESKRQITNFVIRELISQVPPDLGVEVLMMDSTHRLLDKDHEWDLWASTFLDLVSRGADVRSRRIFKDLVRIYEYFTLATPPARFDTHYTVVEQLLAVHRVDPNYCEVAEAAWGRFRRPPLHHFVDLIAAGRMIIESDDEFGPAQEDPVALEPRFCFLMRVIDLLLRHGARCSAADLLDFESGEEDVAMKNWILARPDCTQRTREAINRGDLCY